MSNQSIGFVGGGRITRIFLEGWQRANALPTSIVVSDCHAETLAKLQTQFPGVQTAADSSAAASQDIVFLAVHPPVMAEVAARIKGSLKPGAVVVSLSPKFTVAKLTGLLGGFDRLARIIPNAPSVVNCGFNPVAFGPALTAPDKAALTSLLTPLGECPEVAEEKLEVYAVFTARGPTYFWFQFYELRRFAETSGLTAEEAQRGLEALVAGTLKTMTAAGLGREEVSNLIPVKTPAEMEEPVTEVFRKQLPAILEQIKP